MPASSGVMKALRLGTAKALTCLICAFSTATWEVEGAEAAAIGKTKAFLLGREAGSTCLIAACGALEGSSSSLTLTSGKT